MSDLLSVDEALARILIDFQCLKSEPVPLDHAWGRVLAQDITAPHALPPFANSSMDGFAVRAANLKDATKDQPVRLRVVADIPAGHAAAIVLKDGEAARIMTGAALPEGSDAVIPVEETDANFQKGQPLAIGSEVSVYAALKPGDSVRAIGEDVRAGDTVLSEGMLISPGAVGVLAALGIAEVPMVRRPRVAIISSGDELVPVEMPLTPGTIHDANSYTLSALIRQYGAVPLRIPTARDTLDDVRRAFQEALDSGADVILSSAGVSVGAVDLVRTVLEQMGQLSFWRINLRPGKPLAYGRVGEVPFFGLPGNPVSAMVTFEVFVRPVLLKLAGRTDQPQTIQAALAEDIPADGRRTYFRVTLQAEKDRWIAHLTGTQSSGALSSMVKADGLLILPEGVTFAPAGSVYSVRVLRPLV
ncbi:MAG: gephyrin-like molybdotransferase Glp [Anaerolineae bacterium]